MFDFEHLEDENDAELLRCLAASDQLTILELAKFEALLKRKKIMITGGYNFDFLQEMSRDFLEAFIELAHEIEKTRKRRAIQSWRKPEANK